MDMDPSDEEWMDPFVPEEPEGTFLKLEKDLTYYVYIVQDAAQEEKDRKAMAGKLETLKAAAAGLDEKARTTEGCRYLHIHERCRVGGARPGPNHNNANGIFCCSVEARRFASPRLASPRLHGPRRPAQTVARQS